MNSEIKSQDDLNTQGRESDVLIATIMKCLELVKEKVKLENENARLKELLKECMDMFVKMYSTNTVNSAFIDLYENIKTKIEEALK